MGSIEVRELIIKATVISDSETTGTSTGVSATENNASSPSEELIKSCVEKILEILKDKDGR